MKEKTQTFIVRGGARQFRFNRLTQLIVFSKDMDI